jgi:Tol biopolymer transport system component
MISSNTSNFDGFVGLAWTPEGRLVYSSYASGDLNIWGVAADGSNPKQITAGKGYDSEPSVSPDGRTIVFCSRRTGSMNIWRMDVDGGNLRQLSSGDSDFLPEISSDGKWVVYESFRSGGTGLQKVPIEGGKPIQLNDEPSFLPVISPDGKYIAYRFKGEKPRIGIIPFNGGKPTKVFDDTGGWFQWSPDGTALDYVDVQRGVANIWRQPIVGGPPRKVTDFTQDRIFWFAYSRDGKQLALARGTQPSDVVMISNFK